jgi:competence protein ComFC
MTYCVLCGNVIQYQAGWFRFFVNPQDPVLCRECEQKFQLITGEVCDICGRPFVDLPAGYKSGTMCFDCVRWKEDIRYSGVLDKNRSIYSYNQWMKEVMSRFKFRGDAALASIFTEPIRTCFRTCFSSSSLLVPIPLSMDRLYERGFNQAQLLAQAIGGTCAEPLVRVHSEKQSKKSRMERLQAKEVFRLLNQHVVIDQNIVLIDDIYTTGTTIRQAAKLLKEAGAKSVSSLTLCRGIYS